MKSRIKDNSRNEIAEALKNAATLTTTQIKALVNMLMLNDEFAQQMQNVDTDDYAKFRKLMHSVLTNAQIAELSSDQLEFLRHPQNFDRDEKFIADHYILYVLSQVTGVQYQFIADDQEIASTFAGYQYLVAEFKRLPYVDELYVTLYDWHDWHETPMLSVRDIGVAYTLNKRKGYTKFNVPEFAPETAQDLQQLFDKNWPQLHQYATAVDKDEGHLPLDKIMPLLETAAKNDAARIAASPITPIYYNDVQ